MENSFLQRETINKAVTNRPFVCQPICAARGFTTLLNWNTNLLWMTVYLGWYVTSYFIIDAKYILLSLRDSKVQWLVVLLIVLSCINCIMKLYFRGLIKTPKVRHVIKLPDNFKYYQTRSFYFRAYQIYCLALYESPKK